MAIAQNKNANDALIDSGPTVRDFGAIETLNAWYAENGWEADYRQLEAGILASQAFAREIGRIGLFRERISHKIECSARSPDEHFSIVLSMAQDQVSINGHRVDEDKLLLIPPNSHLEISATGRSDAVTIDMSVDMFGDYLQAVGGDDSLAAASGIRAFLIDRDAARRFRQFLNEVAFRPLQKEKHNVVESILATKLCAAMIVPATNEMVGDPYRRLAKRRIITRAKEYIFANLDQHFQIPDLCAYCGVSLSTLERVFRDQVNVGPKGYILAARLHEARRNLLDRRFQDDKIAEIAMNCGFAHMGRFAHRYKTHFGLLPSEERSPIIN